MKTDSATTERMLLGPKSRASSSDSKFRFSGLFGMVLFYAVA